MMPDAVTSRPVFDVVRRTGEIADSFALTHSVVGATLRRSKYERDMDSSSGSDGWHTGDRRKRTNDRIGY